MGHGSFIPGEMTDSFDFDLIGVRRKIVNQSGSQTSITSKLAFGLAIIWT